MKKFVTLNEYIASLQKIAQKHGNAEVLSLGSVTGTAGGLQNPRSVHLVINGKEETFYVPCYQEERKPNDDSPWNDGRLQIAGCTFRFWIKRFDEGSEFGIEGGRISKLTIKNERTGKEVVNYDRGWDIQPKTKSAQEALAWVLRNFN